ncbi:MAG: FtsQ-type POTRA domain-containing protein [Opitutales bacterium]
MIGRGRGKGGSAATGSQSWRELAGAPKKRINSPQAKKRRRTKLLKLSAAVLLLAVLIALVFWLSSVIKNREEPIQLSTPSREIQQIIFETDGVLPDRWLSSVIRLSKGTTMMEVDIHGMKQSLEDEPQVRSASVERVFPASLKISVKERQPVLRIAVAGPDGEPVQRIVARDGTIYEGTGYPGAALARMPFLQPYRHGDGRIRPLRGIGRVADLLTTARQQQPELYRTWKVVSLEHYSGDLSLVGEVIEVRTGYVPRIIFGASTDFGKQLDRLKVILDHVRARGNPAMERIDLSLRGSAAVQFSSGRVSSF